MNFCFRQTTSFTRFKDALCIDWRGEGMSTKAKKTPNTYFIMRGNVGLLLQCGFPKHSIFHIFFFFPYLGSAHQVFQSPRSPVLCFFYLYSFLLHVFSYNISLHLSFGLLIFRCPTTSIFHVLITTSSVFLSTCPKHLSLISLIFSLMFATPGPNTIKKTQTQLQTNLRLGVLDSVLARICLFSKIGFVCFLK